MRILFALSGLHRFERGAEIALTALATELSAMGDTVTLIGAGNPIEGKPYRFIHAGAIARERFESLPHLPVLRDETSYEEASFMPGLIRHYRPADYDVTATCSFPFTNWALRRPAFGARRPAHVFITQNGDWAAYSNASEYRFFGCDGLVCINPDYYERCRDRWPAALIPNGVDIARFTEGPDEREQFGFPGGRTIVLMVSALIDSKRVSDGVRAVAAMPNAHLVVAGDGPLRDEIDALAARMLPERFTRLTVASARMPALYRSADVFLHLSRTESFGNVFVEAMACGLPVVAHDWARSRWIMGDSEFLVDTGDPAAIAAALRAARDEPRAMRMRRRARADRFAWSAVAREYRDFFQLVVENRRSA